MGPYNNENIDIDEEEKEQELLENGDFMGNLELFI